jgi:hypothetical protein
MSEEFINEEFIQIPSYLTDDITTESVIIQPMAECTDWCEHYDECCGYEKCMGACQTCQSSCESGSCQSACQSSCQTSCEESCQSACESVCQLACENACQYACENYCMTECESCETACQGTCLDACQVCEGVCQTSCETYCENCQTTCEKYCESACQLGCQSGQTNPKLPNPTLDTSATVKTGNSITITINPVTGADTYYARINGGSHQSSSGRTFTFLGLLPNTQYLIEIKVSGVGYQDSDWVGYYATTLEAILWEWWTPKEVDNLKLSPDEWLAFCNKINEVRISKGLLSYPFTTSPTYIADDKVFPVWVFLQAVNAINEMGGIAPQLLTVKSMDESPWGDDSIIYPWYFDNLKTALNNAINS